MRGPREWSRNLIAEIEKIEGKPEWCRFVSDRGAGPFATATFAHPSNASIDVLVQATQPPLGSGGDQARFDLRRERSITVYTDIDAAPEDCETIDVR